jgi:hypothetical protein
MLEAKIPDGPLENKWSHYRSTAKLVGPGNRRKLHVIVVGTGALTGSPDAYFAGGTLSRLRCHLQKRERVPLYIRQGYSACFVATGSSRGEEACSENGRSDR